MIAPPAVRRVARFEASVRAERVEPPIEPAEARRFLRDLARRLAMPHDSVAVVFSDDAFLRRLNHRYHGEDRPTDVLSFRAGETGAGGHLGDIAISSQAARRRARRRGHPERREARVLLLHGVLHLLGYDHVTDDGQMDLLERTLRSEVLEGRGPRR